MFINVDCNVLSIISMAATRSLNTSRKKKQSLPFYELPSSKTSAKIIAEARQSVRALPTNRPTTPADHRILFGNNSSHSRPPSAFSIGAHHFTDERLSRPGTGPILPPIGQNIAKDITKKVCMIIKEVTRPTFLWVHNNFYHDLVLLYRDVMPSIYLHYQTAVTVFATQNGDIIHITAAL